MKAATDSIRRLYPKGWSAVLLLIALLVPAGNVASETLRKSDSAGTKVVLLGTGNPMPDPDRSGPATAIVVNGSAYLIDFGPGVVRRAAAAMQDRGIKELNPANLRVIFNTHLHSDHTAGYPDLILTPWTLGRREPLEAYGPKGLKDMTEHILAAYSEDIRIRTTGMEQIPAGTCTVNAHEISPGVIYQDDNVKVTAFPTKHGDWEESFGYKFETSDRTIVITGDTTPIPATIEACNGCDILIHEAQTQKFLKYSRRPNTQGFDLKAYAAKYHTTTTQLAELANQAKPGLLILQHNSITLRPDKRPFASSPDDLLREIRAAGYKGQIVVGRDLDVY
jgi:ribonuclease BN (tRNA processing enzyme)